VSGAVRKPSLGEQLGDYLGARLGQPFEWPTANCCHFAAQWVECVEGSNPMADLPPTASALEAMRLVRELGGSLESAWTRQLGRDAIAPAFAQLGDVVLLPLPVEMEAERATGEAVGVCVGAHAVVMTAEGFQALMPMSTAVAAWRVGFTSRVQCT
jgi:hypothetical protein